MHSAHKTYTITPAFSFTIVATLVIGTVLGILYPYSILKESLPSLTTVLVSVVLYCVVPAVFFAEILALYQLIQQKLLGFVLKRCLMYIGIFLGALLIISILIVVLLPPLNILPLVSSPENLSGANIASIVEELFPPNFLQIFAISKENILTLIVCGAILAYAYSLRSKKQGIFAELLYELTDIVDILVKLVSYVTIPLCLLSSYGIVSQFFVSEFRESFTPLLLSLFFLFIVLVCFVLPLIFRYTGVNIRYQDWIRGILTSSAIAFSTGSVLVAYRSTLSLNAKRNTRSIVTHTSYTITFVLGRIGTAMCIAIFYIALFNSFYATPILLREIIVIVLMSILYSFVASARAQSILFIALAGISKVSYVSIQDFYLVLLPYAVIMKSFAASFDVLCITVVNLLVNARYEKRFLIFTPPVHGIDNTSSKRLSKDANTKKDTSSRVASQKSST